jgi:ribosomal protein S14
MSKPKTRTEERRALRPVWKKERRRLMRKEGMSRRQVRKLAHRA